MVGIKLLVAVISTTMVASCSGKTSVAVGTINSNTKSGTDILVPNAPVIQKVAAGNREVNLTWLAPDSDGGSAITDYLIRYSADAGANWSTFTDDVGVLTSAKITSLDNGTEYIFQVAAVNAVGNGSYSANSSPTTPSLSCANDCYLEGSAPNFAQALAVGTTRLGPDGSVISLQYASGSSGFKIWKDKYGSRILNATGKVANGWQKMLNETGNAFTDTDFSDSLHIAKLVGRACPPNVFLGFDNMLATGRCLYYDAGNPSQALSSAIPGLGLQSPSSGRGSNASYYEGNIATCSSKGMRLPTVYETQTSENDSPSNTSDLPAGDGISPQWALGQGVPCSGNDWLASAVEGQDGAFFTCSIGSPLQQEPYSFDGVHVRCVLP
jgi:hypothetical protein